MLNFHNMKRRVVVNILLAFVLLPILKNIRMFFDVVILGNEMPYHLAIDYWRYMEIHIAQNFLFLPLAYLIIVLIPYNLILLKDPINPKLLFRSLWVKILFLTGNHILLICLLGTFANIWAVPYWQNVYYVGFALLYSSIMATIIHFAVDKKEIREMEKLSS